MSEQVEEKGSSIPGVLGGATVGAAAAYGANRWANGKFIKNTFDIADENSELAKKIAKAIEEGKSEEEALKAAGLSPNFKKVFEDAIKTAETDEGIKKLAEQAEKALHEKPAFKANSAIFEEVEALHQGLNGPTIKRMESQHNFDFNGSRVDSVHFVKKGDAAAEVLPVFSKEYKDALHAHYATELTSNGVAEAEIATQAAELVDEHCTNIQKDLNAVRNYDGLHGLAKTEALTLQQIEEHGNKAMGEVVKLTKESGGKALQQAAGKFAGFNAAGLGGKAAILGIVVAGVGAGAIAANAIFGGKHTKQVANDRMPQPEAGMARA